MRDIVVAVVAVFATAVFVFLITAGSFVQNTRNSIVKDCATVGFFRQGNVGIKCEVLDNTKNSR